MKVPYDEQTEAEVVACAIADALGRREVAARLDPRDCYVPGHVRLLEAAAALDDIAGPDCDPGTIDWAELYPLGYPDFEHLRAAAAAVIADEDIAAVRRLVKERGGTQIARRAAAVTAIAQKRRVMAVLADAYNALGDGADVDDVAELVAGAVA